MLQLGGEGTSGLQGLAHYSSSESEDSVRKESNGVRRGKDVRRVRKAEADRELECAKRAAR